MKAVILAGGEGTRLRPLTYTRPKAMVPFLNKPVIGHIIEKLVRQGFDDITITSNYLASQIREYVKNGENWEAKITVVEEKHPLGTAGSVKNSLRNVDGPFAVVQGDNISDIDIRRLYREHKKMGGELTISLMEVADVSHFGIAEMRDGEIVKYLEKPAPDETFSNLANDGIYILEPSVLDYIPSGFYDFSRDLFPRMLQEGKKICGSITTAFWRDIGTPAAYLEATQHYLRRKNFLGSECSLNETKLLSSVFGDHVNAERSAVKYSVVFEGTRIGAGSKLKSCIVGSNCVIGEDVDIWPGAVIGDNVYIGSGCVVKGNARVGPHLVIERDREIEGVIVPDKYKSKARVESK